MSNNKEKETNYSYVYLRVPYLLTVRNKSQYVQRREVHDVVCSVDQIAIEAAIARTVFLVEAQGVLIFEKWYHWCLRAASSCRWLRVEK